MTDKKVLKKAVPKTAQDRGQKQSKGNFEKKNRRFRNRENMS